jgi:hypothetical protein
VRSEVERRLGCAGPRTIRLERLRERARRLCSCVRPQGCRAGQYFVRKVYIQNGTSYTVTIRRKILLTRPRERCGTRRRNHTGLGELARCAWDAPRVVWRVRARARCGGVRCVCACWERPEREQSLPGLVLVPTRGRRGRAGRDATARRGGRALQTKARGVRRAGPDSAGARSSVESALERGGDVEGARTLSARARSGTLVSRCPRAG